MFIYSVLVNYIYYIPYSTPHQEIKKHATFLFLF